MKTQQRTETSAFFVALTTAVSYIKLTKELEISNVLRRKYAAYTCTEG